MANITLDPEFKARNRKQTPQERSNLLLMIEQYGVRDGALVCAKITGDDKLYLIDGYNTLQICEEQGIKAPEPLVHLFDSRQEVLEWIDRNQRARRNLTAEEMAARAQERREQIADDLKANKPVTEIAKKQGVSRSTVLRDIETIAPKKRVVGQPRIAPVVRRCAKLIAELSLHAGKVADLCGASDDATDWLNSLETLKCKWVSVFNQCRGKKEVLCDNTAAAKKGHGVAARLEEPGPALPEMLNTARFREAWAEWEKHRREIKKRLTPMAIRKQFGQLVSMGEARAVEAINHSIAQGYQGIFEPKNGSKPHGENAVQKYVSGRK